MLTLVNTHILGFAPSSLLQVSAFGLVKLLRISNQTFIQYIKYLVLILFSYQLIPDRHSLLCHLSFAFTESDPGTELTIMEVDVRFAG